VMDVDVGNKVYSKSSIYRRTVVMVDASDDVSYGIDFFRVKGGDDHLYSFHAMSDEIGETSGIDNMVSQPMGTYMGPDVPYGPNAAYTNGFNWLTNVRRAV
ncbi:MAG: hypothetical protein RR994_02550, partial [Clostridia bacterium]